MAASLSENFEFTEQGTFAKTFNYKYLDKILAYWQTVSLNFLLSMFR